MARRPFLHMEFLIQALIGVFLIISPMDSFAESLYVFFPTTVGSNYVQSQLEKACPGVTITVFGRYRDFSTDIKNQPPDAIIAKTLLVKTFNDYTIKLQGVRNNGTEEAFVLVSVKKKVDPKDAISVGVIDILGRKGMNEYLGNYFTPMPKLKIVTKVEDLLPLLTFDMAQALLITEYHIDYLKKISELNFVVTPVPGMKGGIIALALRNNGNTSAIPNAVKSMDAASNAILEIETWK